jgi:hypothetical protein
MWGSRLSSELGAKHPEKDLLKKKELLNFFFYIFISGAT